MGKFLAAFAFCVALAVGSAQPARAQTFPESHLGLAREVVQLSGAEGAMREMMTVMAPAMVDQIMASGVSREFADRFVTLFVEEFAAETPRVIDLTAFAYAGAFTEAQLRDIRDFYASPTGRVFVQQSQQLTAAMTRAGMVIGEEVSHRVMARLQAEQAGQQHQP